MKCAAGLDIFRIQTMSYLFDLIKLWDFSPCSITNYLQWKMTWYLWDTRWLTSEHITRDDCRVDDWPRLEVPGSSVAPHPDHAPARPADPRQGGRRAVPPPELLLRPHDALLLTPDLHLIRGRQCGLPRGQKQVWSSTCGEKIRHRRCKCCIIYMSRNIIFKLMTPGWQSGKSYVRNFP